MTRTPPSADRDASDRVLRHFERDVLDRHHRSMALWALPRPEALYSLLRAYDSMLVVAAEVESHRHSFTHVGPYQYLKHVDEGLVHALRWLSDQRPFESIQPTDSAASLDAGGAFLVHAADYAALTTFHVLYSRGAIGVRVDEAKRLIRFEPRSPDKHDWTTFAERFTIYDTRPKPSAAQHAALFALLSTLEYGQMARRLVLQDPASALHPVVQAYSRMAQPREQLALPPSTDLVGFSISQFRDFWFVLYCWSQVLLGLFLQLVYPQRHPQHRCMPTQVHQLDAFVTTMTVLSKLDRSVVVRLVERLSYDPTYAKSDPFLTPLIVAGGDLAWSPLCVTLSRIERNLLKAMARRVDLRDHAATLIGHREKPMLREFGLLLAERGSYSYKLFSNISVGNESGEIDLLAYTARAPKEVLLVEGKAMLAADDASDSLVGGAELLHAHRQLMMVTRLLQAIPLEQKQALYPFVRWEVVDIYRCLILTPDTPLGHAVDESLTPVVTLDTAKTHLRRKHYRSPSALWETCQAKPWLAQFDTGPATYQTMSVGDVTYEVPYIGELPSETTSDGLVP